MGNLSLGRDKLRVSNVKYVFGDNLFIFVLTVFVILFGCNNSKPVTVSIEACGYEFVMYDFCLINRNGRKKLKDCC